MGQFYVGVLYIVLSAAAFGVMPIFAVYAYQGGSNVVSLLAVRFLMAAVLFLLVILFTRKRWKLTVKQVLSLFVMGGILYTVQSFSYFSAVQYIPASLAALLLYTFPIYVAILAYFIEKEALNKQTVFSILLSIGGLVLILGTSFGQINLMGILLALIAAVVYAVYIITGNRLIKHIPPLFATVCISFFASLSFFTVGWSTKQLHFDFTEGAWWSIAGIAVISTVIAMFTFFKGLELIGSTKSSILSTVEPVITIAASTFLLKEHITWMQLLGGVAVLTGALLVVATRSKSTEDLSEN